MGRPPNSSRATSRCQRAGWVSCQPIEPDGWYSSDTNCAQQPTVDGLQSALPILSQSPHSMVVQVRLADFECGVYPARSRLVHHELAVRRVPRHISLSRGPNPPLLPCPRATPTYLLLPNQSERNPQWKAPSCQSLPSSSVSPRLPVSIQVGKGAHDAVRGTRPRPGPISLLVVCRVCPHLAGMLQTRCHCLGDDARCWTYTVRTSNASV